MGKSNRFPSNTRGQGFGNGAGSSGFVGHTTLDSRVIFCSIRSFFHEYVRVWSEQWGTTPATPPISPEFLFLRVSLNRLMTRTYSIQQKSGILLARRTVLPERTARTRAMQRFARHTVSCTERVLVEVKTGRLAATTVHVYVYCTSKQHFAHYFS